MPYVVLATGSTVVGPMQLSLDPVQNDPHPRAVTIVDLGSEML
jgi:hypothetical protein